MRCNVGDTDRFIRILIGLVIFVVCYIYENWWGLIGLFILLTALFRWCPAYLPFKMNTNKSKK